MKMSEPILCCADCLEGLEKRDPNCSMLWMHLCDIQHSQNGVFGLKTNDFAHLRNLELMRFIITREVPGMILIKVKSKFNARGESYFCGGMCGQ